MSPHLTNHEAAPELAEAAPVRPLLAVPPAPVRTVEVAAKHLPEYLMEAAGLGLFMISACAFGLLLEFPGSPVREAVSADLVRRALAGMAMGLTLAGLIYSPWGQQSGAHLNPAVTLSFLRLGKIRRVDAIFYVFFQIIGGLAGVLLVSSLFPAEIAHPAVNWAATVPGSAGEPAAFAAEFVMSFGMMTLVLNFINHQRLERWTGVAAAVLLAAYITVEVPISGMSINPARTVASALPAGNWMGFWIYLSAPLLGMLSAAEVFRHQGRVAHCAKLNHNNLKRCIFCGKEQHASAGRACAIGG